jgi:hypothetical protein
MPPISLAHANLLNSASNVATIIGGLMTFAGAIGIFWSGGIRDEYADRRASELENATAVARADAAKANESNTRLQIELERERSERMRLEQQVAPRALTEAQRSEIHAALRQSGWKDAEILWHGAGEPEHYAKDFAATFSAAGITTQVHTLGMFIPSADGLIVVKTQSDDWKHLLEILQAAGLHPDVADSNDTMGAKDHPTLVVGSRKRESP